MNNPSSRLLPILCAAMLLASTGCNQKTQQSSPITTPSEASVTDPDPTPAPDPVPESAPATLSVSSKNVRVVPLLKDISHLQAKCAAWDHASRRAMEEQGETSCVSWLHKQSRNQHEQPSRAYRLAEGAKIVFALAPGARVTPEVIAWHITHRAFLDVDCGRAIPKGLVYVRCKIAPITGEHLRARSSIRHLDVSYNPGARGVLADIGRMTQLESLVLERSALDAKSLSRLSGLSNLRTLHLIDAKLDDAGLAHLKTLPSLTELILRDNKGVTDKGLQHIASLTRLKTLDVSDIPGLSATGLAALATLPALEHLAIGGGVTSGQFGFSAQALHPLGDIKTLTYLDTAELPLDAEGARHLGGLTNLLAYEGVISSASHLASLNTLSGLEALTIQGDLGADALGKLKGLGSLRTLNTQLKGPESIARCDDTMLRHISTFSALRRLEVCFSVPNTSTITDAGVAQLSPLKHLRRLALGAPSVTSKGLKPLTSLPLRSLDAHITNVCSDALPDLLMLTQLEHVALNVDCVDEETEQALSAELPSCKEGRCTIELI